MFQSTKLHNKSVG